mmetsp:Transcript_7547/g.12547  ORF Transcript_7547/g.12547 Transcript_7547/m.12547 type:complete len:161 (+) Transcript_7547:61-543(+)
MSVTLETNLGKIKLEIFCDLVPKASFNFLALAASGYYDSTIFHRNIKGFMVQGGDPSGTGKGGESIWGNGFADEFHPDLRHDKRGTVSFANNKSDDNRSQFFLAYGPQPHLNSKYTLFGQVIEGIEVLDAFERIPVGKKNRPVQDIRIENIIIHANPLAG